jgi:uncharacterized phosphosugar-binding protein
MSPGAEYLSRSRRLVDRVEAQLPEVRMAARWFSETILAGRMVHLFGSGHSRILVEEMWPRYGSFPGFNPIVELSLSFHNLVVGANGQRQAMFLENVSGLAARILRNYDLSPQDTALVASSSGCNVVPIEMAEEFRRRRIRVVAVISKQHSDKSRSQRADGKKLQDFADLVLDTGAPVGDAMVKIPGLDTPVAPGSTVGGCLLINAIKAELADRLTKAGHPPLVLTAGALVGKERATELFEAAYDEHARRLARLYADIGAVPPPQPASKPASKPVPSPVRAGNAGGGRPGIQADAAVRSRPPERPIPRPADRSETSHDRFPVPEPRARREERQDTDGRSSGWSPGAPRTAARDSADRSDRPVTRGGRDGRSRNR